MEKISIGGSPNQNPQGKCSEEKNPEASKNKKMQRRMTLKENGDAQPPCGFTL